MMMTNRSRHTVVATAVLSAMMLILTACGDDTDETPSTTTPATSSSTQTPEPTSPDVPQVGAGEGLSDESYVDLDRSVFDSTDDSDAESVIVDGLTESFSWDPATQSNGFAAFQDASTVWNNTYLSDEELSLTTLTSVSGRDWQAWADNGKRFDPKVTITNEQHPPDTDTDVSRVTKIEMYSVDRVGNRDLVMTLIAPVRAHHAEQGWRLSSISVLDTILPRS